MLKRCHRSTIGIVGGVVLLASGCVRAVTSDDDDGDSTAASSGSGSTGSSGGTCYGDQASCADANSLALCDGGQLTTFTCEEYCGTNGFAPGPCSASACQCGEPINSACLAGVLNLCACREAGGLPCTDEDLSRNYNQCHRDFPYNCGMADYYTCWGEIRITPSCPSIEICGTPGYPGPGEDSCK